MHTCIHAYVHRCICIEVATLGEEDHKDVTHRTRTCTHAHMHTCPHAHHKVALTAQREESRADARAAISAAAEEALVEAARLKRSVIEAHAARDEVHAEVYACACSTHVHAHMPWAPCACSRPPCVCTAPS